MIKNNKPISMIESTEYIAKAEGTETDELNSFIKKFSKLNLKEAKELRKKIEGIDSLRINEENIAKIIDLMPEDEEDLNKIFVDISLDEDEKKKILEAIKEFK